MSATIVALITVGIILTAVTTALMTSNQTIPTDGTITPTPTPTTSAPVTTPATTPPPETCEIAIYLNEECTQECESITWNTVAPGGSTTKTVYIKNEGTQAVTLHLATSNLSPAQAEGLIHVTWNKEGQTLTAGASANAILTLSVDASISGITSYSIDVTIQGTATT